MQKRWICLFSDSLSSSRDLATRLKKKKKSACDWHRAPRPHFSTCGLLCESAERVNTHQLSGPWSCPLQVLTVNPGGGKVNTSPSDNNTAPTICSRRSADRGRVYVRPRVAPHAAAAAAAPPRPHHMHY